MIGICYYYCCTSSCSFSYVSNTDWLWPPTGKGSDYVCPLSFETNTVLKHTSRQKASRVIGVFCQARLSTHSGIKNKQKTHFLNLLCFAVWPAQAPRAPYVVVEYEVGSSCTDIDIISTNHRKFPQTAAKGQWKLLQVYPATLVWSSAVFVPPRWSETFVSAVSSIKNSPKCWKYFWSFCREHEY